MTSRHRGSALLIVLGMLAFMVISAVAFSAYMRYSRLPSSFLRRTVSSRLLVKAALAEAIEEIDVAIGNNPHPGVGTAQYNLPREPTASGVPAQVCANRNWWAGRVYIGNSEESSSSDGNVGTKNSSSSSGSNTTIDNNLLNQWETVPTLTLEGLAYIPPPLVNEARYYSRHSNAATWHQLPYDAGRYAFCAIDVSDYFDVNVVQAGLARNSSPMGRVSLAYLFEGGGSGSDGVGRGLNGSGGGGSSGDADAWDKFMENFTGGGSKVPLTSVADWNLAVNQYKPGGLTSHFCDYVKNSYSDFYNGPGLSEKQAIACRVFVTDSWYPDDPCAVSVAGSTAKSSSSSSTTEIYDLTTDEGQPLGKEPKQNIAGSTIIYNANALGGNESLGFLRDKVLCKFGLCALYDYLDLDRIPCSLAVPTTERVPMICAIQPNFPNMSLAIKPSVKEEGEPPAEGGSFTYTRTAEYILDASQLMGMAQARVDTVIAYPFRHQDNVSAQFEIDGRVSFFLTSEDMGLRTGTANDLIHFSKNKDLATATVADANGDGTPDYNAIIDIPLGKQSVSFSNDIKTEQDALKKLTLNASGANNLPSDIGKIKIANVVVSIKCEAVKDPDTGALTVKPSNYKEIVKDPYGAGKGADGLTVQAGTEFVPLRSNGTRDGNNFSTDTAHNLEAVAQGDGLECKLNAAVWIRMKYKSGDSNSDGDKTVDLVPACLGDDYILNLQSTYNQIAMTIDNQYLGKPFPILRFDTGATLTYKLEPEVKNAEIVLAPKAIAVGDPRYNYAPESWFQVDNGIASELDWLNLCHAHDNKKDGATETRDGDIFMSVSDQGYLQSVYELANLPRLTDFYNSGNLGDSIRGNSVRPDGFYSGLTIPANFESTANSGFMWKTYCPFPGKYQDRTSSSGMSVGDNFFDLPFSSTGTGPKVCPYSDSTNVIMAAFANTPHEWRLAGTNENSSVIKAGLPDDSKTFNKKYAWNEQCSSGAKVAWEDLEAFAGDLMEDVRNNAVAKGNQVFDYVWNNIISWECTEEQPKSEHGKYLAGIELTETSDQGKIYCADKKFLYGYWRDCFAAKQQLFLVFVRAEPALMGGGSVHQSPPALGGRAVALVWRDPAANSGSDDTDNRCTPHKTRVLFYRPLD